MHLESIVPARRHKRAAPWKSRHHNNNHHHYPCCFPADIQKELDSIEETFKKVDREIRSIQNHVDTAFRDVEKDPNAVCVKINLNSDFKLESDEGKGKLLLHMGEDYNPKDISISLTDRLMTVTATKESMRNRARTFQKINRSFIIPESMDVEHLKTVWNTNGTLCVEGPLQPQQQALRSPTPETPPTTPPMEQDAPTVEHSDDLMNNCALTAQADC